MKKRFPWSDGDTIVTIDTIDTIDIIKVKVIIRTRPIHVSSGRSTAFPVEATPVGVIRRVIIPLCHNESG